MAKTSIASLRRILKARRAKGEKWRAIGLYYPGVKLGTLARIAYDDAYEPKSQAIRAALGLPPCTVSVEPCTKCGQVHTLKHCPEAPRKYAPHPVMRITAIRRLLQSPYRDS